MSVRNRNRVRGTGILLGVVILLCSPVLAQEGDGMRVTESGVGTDVVDHQLVGAAESFAEGTQVVFWTRVEGGAEGDVVQHAWIHQGTERLVVDLGVGGSHWRTYSRKMLHEGLTGEWTVEARDLQGNVLASASFTCEPSAGE